MLFAVFHSCGKKQETKEFKKSSRRFLDRREKMDCWSSFTGSFWKTCPTSPQKWHLCITKFIITLRWSTWSLPGLCSETFSLSEWNTFRVQDRVTTDQGSGSDSCLWLRYILQNRLTVNKKLIYLKSLLTLYVLKQMICYLRSAASA